VAGKDVAERNIVAAAKAIFRATLLLVRWPHQDFHWQTQNNAGPDTPAGRRYIESPDNGWRFFLFVRENKEAAYCALGPAIKVHIEGDRPMSLQWKLEVALPMELFRAFSVLRA